MTAAHRVVVVGHGMVAARFVDLLLTYADRTGTAVSATVLGDEPHEPYNRLMLSEVMPVESRPFHMAASLALLEQGELIDRLEEQFRDAVNDFNGRLIGDAAAAKAAAE